MKRIATLLTTLILTASAAGTLYASAPIDP